MSIKVKRTLGMRVVDISDKLNVPRVTVEQVLRAYLDSLVDSAQAGENIVIDNIMSIKLQQGKDGDVTLRGRVSPALKSKLSANTGER